MIKALIFDFDGLILDTETPDYLSWKETYEMMGCELPLNLWNNGIGSESMFDPLAYLEKHTKKPFDRAAVLAIRRQRDDVLLAAQSILPGVETYLADAKEIGLKIGLASSSAHEWVDPHLDRLGLRHHFDLVKCRDDVGNRGKPDPAVYRAALEGLEVDGRDALALEDSLNGVTAAKGAGIYCVAVPNQMTRQMNFETADYRLDSLDQLPLTLLIATISK